MDIIKNNKTLFLVILLLALIIRLPNLNKSLWTDEVFNVHGASMQLRDMPGYLAQTEAHPPLSFVLLHFWMKISTNEAWIRFLSVIFGLGICVGMYLLGKFLIDRSFGLLCLSLCAIMPVFVWVSQEVRSYAIGGFFILFSTYYFLRLLRDNNRVPLNFLMYTLFSIGAIYTFYFNFFVIILQNIFFMIFIKEYKKKFVKWFVAQAALIFAFLPWLGNFYSQMALISHHQIVEAHRGVYFGAFHLGTILRAIIPVAGVDPLFFEGVPFIASIPKPVILIIFGISVFLFLYISWTVFKFLKENSYLKDRSFYLIAVLAFVPIIFSSLYEQFTKGGVASRYFFINAMFFTIILAVFLSFIMRKSYKIFVIIFALICIFSAFRLGRVYQPKQDWRGVAQFVEASFNESDVLTFMFSNRSSYEYYAKEPITVYTLTDYAKKQLRRYSNFSQIDTNKEAKLLRFLKGYKRVWVVFSSSIKRADERVFGAWLEEHGFTHADVRKFKGIDVFLFKRG